MNDDGMRMDDGWRREVVMTVVMVVMVRKREDTRANVRKQKHHEKQNFPSSSPCFVYSHSSSNALSSCVSKAVQGSKNGIMGDGNASNSGANGRAGTSAPPEAWAKLSSLTYTRYATGEKLPFPAGLAGLLKAISDVLNHCVATGDLAVRVYRCYSLCL